MPDLIESVQGYFAHDRHLDEARGVWDQWFTQIGGGDPSLSRLVDDLERFLAHHGAHRHEQSRSLTSGVCASR